MSMSQQTAGPAGVTGAAGVEAVSRRDVATSGEAAEAVIGGSVGAVTVGFIGGGNMAAALAAGMLKGMLPAERLHVIEPHDETRARWQAQGVSTANAADDRLADCDVWIFAVKPQVMREVVEQTRPYLRGQLVISIAAGLPLNTLAAWLGGRTGSPWARLVRCMPNTPALVGQGVTGLAAPEALAAADRDLAAALMAAVGQVVWVDNDAALDAVTALSGSGPAYVFLFLEALIEGACKLGLSQTQARDLALGTLQGAAHLAAQSTETPDVLRERVTSKGGTTAAALEVFAREGWRQTVVDAMQAAAQRAQELGRELS